MNIERALDNNHRRIIGIISRVKEEGLLTESQLELHLKSVYEELLPAPAKFFVKEDRFVELCLERKDRYISEINNLARREMFKVV